MFNRDIFFDHVRAKPFNGKLTQQQVDGQNALLGEWEAGYAASCPDLRWLAYALATTLHETASKMWPVTEYGSQAYLKGKPYYPYIGRGFVQLTWEDNYRKATQKLGLTGADDLVKYPDRALDLKIAGDVIYRGMIEGWFTGKKLDGYFNAVVNDPVNARRIVNGNDKDTLIAGYHADFLKAVQASWQDQPAPPEPQPQEVAIDIALPPGVDLIVRVNGIVVT